VREGKREMHIQSDLTDQLAQSINSHRFMKPPHHSVEDKEQTSGVCDIKTLKATPMPIIF
jgi:hypothetical protein